MGNDHRAAIGVNEPHTILDSLTTADGSRVRHRSLCMTGEGSQHRPAHNRKLLLHGSRSGKGAAGFAVPVAGVVEIAFERMHDPMQPRGQSGVLRLYDLMGFLTRPCRQEIDRSGQGFSSFHRCGFPHSNTSRAVPMCIADPSAPSCHRSRSERPEKRYSRLSRQLQSHRCAVITIRAVVGTDDDGVETIGNEHTVELAGERLFVCPFGAGEITSASPPEAAQGRASRRAMSEVWEWLIMRATRRFRSECR
jgi:hypothetical protein